MNAFTGEIRLFPFNYAPEGWAVCDGKELLVPDYSVLYSVIGVTYGGTPGIKFNLPDMGGRTAIGAGTGLNLSPRALGVAVGADETSMSLEQTAPHNHRVFAMSGEDSNAGKDIADATAFLAVPRYLRLYRMAAPSYASPTLHPETVTPCGGQAAGSGAKRDVMQPFLTLRYCICLNGEYPEKS